MAEKPYYGALDGLRAVCIIFTICNHTVGNPGINGTVGVDVFFALSGYLITMLLQRERDADGSVCLGCFYIRRIFRIVPMYLLTIALYVPGALLLDRLSGRGNEIAELRAAAPWLLSFNSEWRPAVAGNVFGHAWTLGVEEKYYVLWPLLFGLLFTRGRWLAVAMLPLFVFLGPDFTTRGYVAIIAGSLAAMAIEGPDLRGKRIVQAAPTHIWFALMVIGYFAATAMKNDSWNLLVSLPSVLFISALINRKDDIYAKAMSHPWLVYAGSLTYIIYLTHRLIGSAVEAAFRKLGMEPPFVLLFPVSYLGCVIAATILSRLIEQPMIRLGKRLSGRYADAHPA